MAQGPSPQAEERPTREEFAREVIGAVRAAGLEGALEHDAGQERLVHAERGSFDLAEAYHALADRSNAQRAEMLAKIARAYANPPSPPERWEDVRERILPHVKPRIVLVAEDLRRQRGEGPPTAPVAEITRDLVFELAVPIEEGTLGVNRELLERWGVEGEATFLTAARNLERRSEENWLVAKDAPGVYSSPWQDGFDASRLFLPRLFGRVPLRGRPVALALAPSRLIFAGSDDEQGLFDLGQMARRSFEKNRTFLFLRPLRMGEDGESWEDWLPEPSHPAHDVLKLLHALGECADYDRQAWLIRRAAPPGEEVMGLPPLVLLQSSIGAQVLTVTVWKSGTPSALPRADAIVFRKEDEILGYASWDEVVRALPQRLDPIPGYPPRFFADDFPEPWQLGGLELKPWGGPSPA